jgi:hypothetical protein
VFSSSFFIILPNIGKYFSEIHFPGIHFPRNSLSKRKLLSCKQTGPKHIKLLMFLFRLCPLLIFFPSRINFGLQLCLWACKRMLTRLLINNRILVIMLLLAATDQASWTQHHWLLTIVSAILRSLITQGIWSNVKI